MLQICYMLIKKINVTNMLYVDKKNKCYKYAIC